MSLKVDTLDWDSNFFGFKIGLINIDSSNKVDLFKLPEILKYQEISMAYLVMPDWNAEIHEHLLKMGAILADKKTTYSKPAEAPVKFDGSLFNVVEFHEKYFTNDLIQLVYASGAYSRFLIDKKFGRKLYEKLYSEWLDKSISGKLADKIWIALDNEKIVGFVTAKKNDESKIGQIGLIAVSENYRGKKIGQSLLAKCNEWYFEHNLKNAKVVTQGDNIAASNFYEADGYKVEKIDYYYHLWT